MLERVRSTSVREGNKAFLGVKTNIFVSDGVELLQMVLEPDTGWCANEDVGPPREVDCEIPHQLERGTKHSL